MTDTRTLSCRCGTMRWRIAPEARGFHVVCYCVDCQTAARALDADALLDPAGGTAIFQTLPADVTILQGTDRLSLMRLSPTGLFRWHAGCCGTPIGNTLTSPGFSFVGMVLPGGAEGFGPITAHVQTKAARVPVREHGFAASGLALMGRALFARLTGRWRRTPFFDEKGHPTAAARVLTPAQRDAARP